MLNKKEIILDDLRTELETITENGEMWRTKEKEDDSYNYLMNQIKIHLEDRKEDNSITKQNIQYIIDSYLENTNMTWTQALFESIVYLENI